MKLLLMSMLLSVNILAANYTDVPKKYKEQIKLNAPKNNLITINNNLKIKGRVNKGTKVFLEEKR